LSFEKNDLLKDIYYQKAYANLYLQNNHQLFVFHYRDGQKLFYSISIKKPILSIGHTKIEDGFYDLETPYGYGGIYSNTDDKQFLKIALSSYEDKCKKENIIAEFTRFHPFNNIPLLLSDFFDMKIHDRNIVYVDLSISKNERWNRYSSNVRNILRKCEKKMIFSKNDNLSDFINLYNKTMDKNDADSFYYFDDKYFNSLFNLDNVELYKVEYNGILLSSSFFMFSADFGHYHLSANNDEYAKYNANYFMLDSIFDIARERNIKYFILGGGRINEEDDSLLKFKQKFSLLTKPFYIAGKVYNNEVYQRYIALWEKQATFDIKYFLKYRLEIQ